MSKNTITVKVLVEAPVEKVWDSWTKPDCVVRWAFASDDWEAPRAENDLKVGGKFKTVMSAKDGTSSFDFTGVYTAVHHHKLIEYDMDDGRHVKVEFEQTPEGVNVIETFEPEDENSLELQKDGWQAILNNFKKYVESEK